MAFHAAAPSPAPTPTPRFIDATPVSGWIVTSAALQGMQQVDAGVVKRMVDRKGTFVLVSGADQVPAGWDVTAAESFTCAHPDPHPNATSCKRALVDTVEEGRLIPGVTAVLLDLESWPLTPHGEQADPVAAYRDAAAVAHQHHLQLIATPALDLARALAQEERHTVWQVFLQELPRRISPLVDVYELQSQSFQNEAATFAQRLAEAHQQAHQANPDVKFFGGVSTNPHGTQTTAAQMAEAVEATHGGTTRYWLNDPGKSDACGSCTGPHPQMAVKFLGILRGTPVVPV